MVSAWLERADRTIGGLVALGAWLVLPVSLLLFLQWPLRDIVHGWSREANDLAQWLFALYVSIALTAASRQRSHLAAAAFVEHYPPALRAAIGRAASVLFLVPWALFVLVAGAPTAWRSIAQREAFAETYNPGYFIIKACVLLLALLMLAQAALDLLRPNPRAET